VDDPELKQITADQVSVTFDLSPWTGVKSIRNGCVILTSLSTGKPLMIEVPCGKGRIFFTAFHNHAQLSMKESCLLKLLVMKLFGSASGTSLNDVGDSMNINLEDYTRIFHA